MKLKLAIIPCVLLIAITLIIASCSKEGPAGATGPAGAQGPQGTSGAAGTPGTTGATGTANVIYSDWIDTVTFHGRDTTGWVAQIIAPQLVDSILNTGAIKVYFNAGSDSSADSKVVMTLPIYEPFLLGAIINPYYTLQNITLISTADVSSFTNNGNHYFQYRYVLIPGGIKAGRGIKGGTNIDWNDYKQVKEFLHLKD